MVEKGGIAGRGEEKRGKRWEIQASWRIRNPEGRISEEIVGNGRKMEEESRKKVESGGKSRKSGGKVEERGEEKVVEDVGPLRLGVQ